MIPITVLLLPIPTVKYMARHPQNRNNSFLSRDYRTNKVFPLGIIPETRGVHHALVEGADGAIYIGTGLNEIELPILSRTPSRSPPGHWKSAWADISARYDSYDGGHIFHISDHRSERRWGLFYQGQLRKLRFEAASGNLVYAMTTDLKTEKFMEFLIPMHIFRIRHWWP